MKAWLKGGLIGLAVGIISFHQSMLTVNSFIPDSILITLSLPFALTMFVHSIFLAGIVGVIVYFIIGAIIGLIVEKIKQKKVVANE